MRCSLHEPVAWRSVALSAMLSVALWACPGRIDDPDLLIGEIDCEAYVPQLLRGGCANSGCHNSVDVRSDLDLAAADLETRLVGVPSRDCPGVLVDPSAPAQSVLYRKLAEPGFCGERMPLLAEPVQPFELDCLLTWIATRTPPESR